MKLSKLFDIEICKNPISKDFALENPGGTPYITTTSENNGIECFVDYPPQYEGGVITVSKDGGNGDAFLQQLPFCGNEKVMVLTPKQALSIQQLFYYVTVIKFNKTMFGYGRKCSVARLGELHIPSPEDIPQFVCNFEVNPITTNNKKNHLPQLNTNNWKAFIIGNLFDVELSKGDIKLDEVDKGDIPLVSSGESNNGIVGYIDRKGDGKAELFAGNKITIDMFGNPFYQKEAFFAVSHGRINILNPKFKLNEAIGLFISSVIKKEKYKFSYGRAVYSTESSNMIIKLPILHNPDGTSYIDESYRYSENGYVPDWDFMENYIKSLPYGDRI